MLDTIQMQLSRVVIQDKADSQYVHLQECGGDRSFPIVIGFSEAYEIHCKLLNHPHRRPMTHDLIGGILEKLDSGVQRVVITDLRDSTFYAVLVLRTSEEARERLVDCRPSDAIAVAVQVGAPIFVARHVLDQVSR